MNNTQAFQIAGATTCITFINVDLIQGHHVVFWEDIEKIFPRIHYIQKAGAVVNEMRDENGFRYVPRRIKHHPGDVLDIVLHPDNSSTAVSSMILPHNQASTFENTLNNSITLTHPICALSAESNSNLAVPPEPLSATDTLQEDRVSANTTHIQDILYSITTAAVRAIQADERMNTDQIIALFHAKLASTSTANLGFEATVNHKLDALQCQVAMIQQNVIKVLELQKQMNDRLILIQSKTQAILTQQIELDEYPIPRLFIVLPEEPTKYDPANWFRTKFRLYFICECGPHTHAVGSKIPNHLHLANHEGYAVREPEEFFKRYGPFLVLMLELIKFGTNIDGHIVPALANLKVVEMGNGQLAAEAVAAKIDYSLECISRQMMGDIQESSLGDMDDANQNIPMAYSGLASYLSNVEGPQGAELRQLGSFLKTSSKDNHFGDLYRTTTSEGHVKWVCGDHYRAVSQEASAQRLRDIVKLSGGTFDKQLGKVNITLQSSMAAAEFYGYLCKSRVVFDLTVDLNWECTWYDVDDLQDALKNSLVSFLYVDLRRFQPSYAVLMLSIPARYAVLHRLLEPVSLRSVHLVLPSDIVSLSNFTPQRPSHLNRLTFEIAIGRNREMDIRILATFRTTGHAGITMYQWDNSILEKGAQALSEALKTTSALTVLDLDRNLVQNKPQMEFPILEPTALLLMSFSSCYASILAKGLGMTLPKFKYSTPYWNGGRGSQTLSEALKIDSTLTTLNLGRNSIGDKGARAISKALKTNSTLIILDLRSNSIGDNGAQALSEAVTINSALTTLNLSENWIEDKGAQAISEALKTNSTLTTLNLSQNRNEDKGAQAIFEALKTNSTLTTLVLERTFIRIKGAQALSEALKTNSAMTTLNLCGNWIHLQGARELSEALKINSTLTTLNLGSNDIEENGSQALSETLKINSALTTLNLERNSIGEKGAQALSEALRINSALTTLNLERNSIGEKGSQALFEALKINSALTALNLEQNSIGERGILALSEALKINSTLTTLNLGSNLISENGEQALRHALKINSKLMIRY